MLKAFIIFFIIFVFFCSFFFLILSKSFACYACFHPCFHSCKRCVFYEAYIVFLCLYSHAYFCNSWFSLNDNVILNVTLGWRFEMLQKIIRQFSFYWIWTTNEVFNEKKHIYDDAYFRLGENSVKVLRAPQGGYSVGIRRV